MFLVITILLIFYKSNKSIFTTKLTKNIDGIDYQVIQDKDPDTAAKLLDALNQFFYKIMRQLKTERNNGQNFGKVTYFIDNLLTKYNPSKIQEGYYIKEGEPGSKGENLANGEPPDTAYVMDKGRVFVMCLRDANGKFHDLNLLKFVAMHEICHIGSIKDQHEEEFWENFKWLLLYTSKRGLFTLTDYSKQPIKYCGTLLVDSNPVFDDTVKTKEKVPDYISS